MPDAKRSLSPDESSGALVVAKKAKTELAIQGAKGGQVVQSVRKAIMSFITLREWS